MFYTVMETVTDLDIAAFCFHVPMRSDKYDDFSEPFNEANHITLLVKYKLSRSEMLIEII